MHHTFLIETSGTAIWAPEKVYKCWGRDKGLKGSEARAVQNNKRSKKCQTASHSHPANVFLKFLESCVQAGINIGAQSTNLKLLKTVTPCSLYIFSSFDESIQTLQTILSPTWAAHQLILAHSIKGWSRRTFVKLSETCAIDFLRPR